MSVMCSLRSALHHLLQGSASAPSVEKTGPVTSFTTWHGNGMRKAEMRYMLGKRHGEWRFWNERGVLVAIQHYERGELLRTEHPEAEQVSA